MLDCNAVNVPDLVRDKVIDPAAVADTVPEASCVGVLVAVTETDDVPVALSVRLEVQVVERVDEDVRVLESVASSVFDLVGVRDFLLTVIVTSSVRERVLLSVVEVRVAERVAVDVDVALSDCVDEEVPVNDIVPETACVRVSVVEEESELVPLKLSVAVPVTVPEGVAVGVTLIERVASSVFDLVGVRDFLLPVIVTSSVRERVLLSVVEVRVAEQVAVDVDVALCDRLADNVFVDETVLETVGDLELVEVAVVEAVAVELTVAVDDRDAEGAIVVEAERVGKLETESDMVCVRLRVLDLVDVFTDVLVCDVVLESDSERDAVFVNVAVPSELQVASVFEMDSERVWEVVRVDEIVWKTV